MRGTNDAAIARGEYDRQAIGGEDREHDAGRARHCSVGFWFVEAWFDHGKEDPQLTMLALEMEDAEIWASTGSKLKFGWEIAKANFNPDEEPDVGVKAHVTFSGGSADHLRHMI